MNDSEAFDACYRRARARLLLQTFALTGDLTSARAGVRDAFVEGWHHWRKVGRLEDPEAWLRPRAWTHAQRRHSAHPWRRERELGPEPRATLEALAHLPGDQRRLLVLTFLAPVSLDQAAEETGRRRGEVESDLQQATSAFSLARDVPSTRLPVLLRELGAAIADVDWPHGTAVRRSGSTRRRSHTALGVLGALVAVAVVGYGVSDQQGVRPALDRAASSVVSAPVASPSAPSGPTTPAPETPAQLLSADRLLTQGDLRTALPGPRWRLVSSATNTSGTGRVLPCQQRRYADADAEAAVLERFAPTRGTAAEQSQRSFQLTEVSRTRRAARDAFDTVAAWYANCRDPRAQLLSTHRVEKVGEQGYLFSLRDWARGGRYVVAALARTGSVLTTTVTTVAATPGADVGRPLGAARARQVRALDTAVEALCPLEAAGACPQGTARIRLTRPLPVGPVVGLLSEVDLAAGAGAAPPLGRHAPREVGHQRGRDPVRRHPLRRQGGRRPLHAPADPHLPAARRRAPRPSSA